MRRLAMDGETLFVDEGAPTRGSEAAFYPVYRDADGRRPWGFRCGECETLETAMDPMGRIVCNRCSNRRRPTEWDAAHE